MLHLQIGAWIAKQTLAFWLRVAGLIVVLAILITPTCMYQGVKEDLEEANAVIKTYEDASKEQRTRARKATKVIVYRDRIIEKKVIQTKIRLEKVYAENPEAKEWADGFIPDAVINSLQDNTTINTD